MYLYIQFLKQRNLLENWLFNKYIMMLKFEEYDYISHIRG